MEAFGTVTLCGVKDSQYTQVTFVLVGVGPPSL